MKKIYRPFNKTIHDERVERFWTVHFKALFLGGLWWLSRKLARSKVRPYRTMRGELLIQSARCVAKRHGWKGIYAWQWEMLFSVANDVSETDSAYHLALYETLREFGKRAKKEKIREWRR
jgi:hypothetical protein